MLDGSIRSTATSRGFSDLTTFAVTFTAGVSCTSTDVAVPIRRCGATMRPFPSTTNPEPRASSVQITTTLFCHRGSRNAGSASGDGAASVAVESTAAAVRVRVCRRQAERRVFAGDDVDVLEPLVGVAVQRYGAV